MSRPVNPNSKYTIKPHVTHGHIYASTQPSTICEVTGRKVYKYIHWGKVIDDVFIPGDAYIHASLEERRKLIFPQDWDLSAIENFKDMRKPGRPSSASGDFERLYGDVWLLERIADTMGVRDDLMKVFGNNSETVDAILTLAYFPYLTKWSYNRLARWQDIEKTPYTYPLSSKSITLLTQSIKEQQRMDFLKLRVARLGRHDVCAVDSTSRSAYGHALSDVKWGHNKERLPLEQSTEVVVYSLTTHQPVYYRTFPGNIPDARSLQVILDDLMDVNVGNVVLVTDRGYDCVKNLEMYIQRGQAMIMCLKTSQKVVAEKIEALGRFDCIPSGMELDIDGEYYYRQYVENYAMTGPNGGHIHADKFRINLYFNPVRRSTERLAIDLDVERQRQALNEIMAGKLRLDDDESLKRLYGYFKITYDVSTRLLLSFEEDSKRIERARKYSGFFALGTLGVNFSPVEASRHYALRDEQEKYFEQMKDQMVADRQKNWSEDGKTGRLFILFISQILASHVRHIWESTELKKKFSSSLEILDEMRSIRCIEHQHHGARLTPFVGKQLDICKAFEFEIPKGCSKEYVSRKEPTRKRGRPPKKVHEVL